MTPENAAPAEDQPAPEHNEIQEAIGPDGRTITAADLAARWPNAPGVMGQIYGFVDHHKVGMVCMTHETWGKIQKDIGALQLLAAQIRAENIQLVQEKERSGRGRVYVPS